ncbi:hypothetical protein FJY68_03030 [candidate division WOR-3 bacterium]|uniref:Outer membrane protein beta-barrel domain-containing protein n=1 Tax=candidate division WOR-3 bacterium TaxID=2052148 RepID=A0A938BQN9_UNCW3|nr:hypothetical protein [candidate division WOR-3 bacterium]
MRRILLVAAVILCAGPGKADAMYLGVGPMIGVPFGLSAKLWTKTGFALDAGIGYSWWADSSVQVHGDMLFHSVRLTKDAAEDGQLGLFMGLGLQARMREPLEQNMRMALRMPLGLEYFLPHLPLSIYGEIVPRFNLGTTDQYFGGDADAGFRFYWVMGSSSLS